MAAIVTGNTITLTGVVGLDLFEDWFSHADVVRALAYFDDAEDITVRLNSPGGHADDGIAIYNAFRARAGKVHVIVDAVAASAGTAIALGGDTVTMNVGALFMVHEAGVTILAGNSTDLEEARRAQAAWTSAYVSIYRKKTGKSDRDIRAYLNPETWFTAEEAKAAGFVDEIGGEAIDITARAPAFPYQAYAKAPERLVALAMSRQWNPPAQTTSQTPPRKEPAMSEKTVSASAHATATARIKTIMQAPEAEGRDKLAEHLAFETTMDAEAAIAIMKAAPEAKGDQLSDAELHAFRRTGADARLNGEGLRGGGDPRKPSGTTGIVAAMKARHGVKQ